MSKAIDIRADEWESEVLRADGPVVVDFWHSMCGWCLKLNPVFANLPKRLEKVKFVKMNVIESPENRKIAIQHGVMGTPTIKVFCKGRVVGEVVGFRPLEKLVNDLKEIFAGKDDCLNQSTPLK